MSNFINESLSESHYDAYIEDIFKQYIFDVINKSKLVNDDMSIEEGEIEEKYDYDRIDFDITLSYNAEYRHDSNFQVIIDNVKCNGINIYDIESYKEDYIRDYKNDGINEILSFNENIDYMLEKNISYFFNIVFSFSFLKYPIDIDEDDDQYKYSDSINEVLSMDLSVETYYVNEEDLYSEHRYQTTVFKDTVDFDDIDLYMDKDYSKLDEDEKKEFNIAWNKIEDVLEKAIDAVNKIT